VNLLKVELVTVSYRIGHLLNKIQPLLEDYLYSSAADYTGEKGILDDSFVVKYCQTMQSRGSRGFLILFNRSLKNYPNPSPRGNKKGAFKKKPDLSAVRSGYELFHL
jgi:hypothetical protein